MKAEREVKQYTLVTVLSPFCSQFFKKDVLTKHLLGSPRQNIHIFPPIVNPYAKEIPVYIYKKKCEYYALQESNTFFTKTI